MSNQIHSFQPNNFPPALREMNRKYLNHDGQITLLNLTGKPAGFHGCKTEGENIVDSWGPETPPDFEAKRVELQRKISKHEISVKKLHARLEEHQKHYRYKDAERTASFLQRTKSDIEAFKNEIGNIREDEKEFFTNEAAMYQSRLASMQDEKKFIEAELKNISARLAKLDSEK